MAVQNGKGSQTAQKSKSLAEHSCSTNFAGSAPAMEPEGVRRIFERSEADRNLQYTGYIRDGDSKSFSAIQRADPYNGKMKKNMNVLAMFKSDLAQPYVR